MDLRLPSSCCLALLVSLSCAALGAGEAGGLLAWTPPAQVPEPTAAASDAATDARWSWYLDHTPRWRLAADAPATALVITNTIPVSPADKAGLYAGDQVLTVDGRRIRAGNPPESSNPASLRVRFREGGERLVELPPGDLGIELAEQPCYDAAWRRTAGHPAAAEEAMQVAVSAVGEEPEIAATALVRARKAGASGPYVHALQATIAVALGRYDEALAAAAVAKLPPEECALLHGVVRDAALCGMRLPFYREWLTAHPELSRDDAKHFPPPFQFVAWNMRDGDGWLQEPLAIAANLPQTDLMPSLPQQRGAWANKLRDAHDSGWCEAPGGRFIKGIFMPASSDFLLRFDLRVLLQTRRHTGWRRYAQVDFLNDQKQCLLRWAVDLTADNFQFVMDVDRPPLQLQIPLHLDGRPNRMEFARYRGLFQVRINGFPALLTMHPPFSDMPFSADLFCEGVTWQISDFSAVRLGGAAKPAPAEAPAKPQPTSGNF